MGVPLQLSQQIEMLYEEFEAIRLADYDNYSQAEAAEKMDVSRPTFTRIYDAARKKVAKAFVEGKSIIIEGGDVSFDKQWYRCEACETVFHLPGNKEAACPSCASKNIRHINKDLEVWQEQRQGGQGQRWRAGQFPDRCKCPSCGTTLPHSPGKPCKDHVCPQCGSGMTRYEVNL